MRLLGVLAVAAFMAAPVAAGGQETPGPTAAPPPAPAAAALTTALSLDDVTNGVATTPGGRVFVVLARLDGSDGPRVAEWIDGKLVPYPDAAWNAWTKDKDPTRTLVRVNSIRTGPDGDLWLVDTGSPFVGKPKLPGGPKLVRIDTTANKVRRIYYLDGETNDKSFIDDVRFNGDHAYVTDAGAPGLIVLDVESGLTRRALDRDPSMTAEKPVSAEGKVLVGPDGMPVFIHADQLEVSPDGSWLYYQPCSGPMSRIETRWLDEPDFSKAALADHVELFAHTPSTGGTAIDAAGNIYLSDTDRQRILKISPEGEQSTLIEDPRLLWVDAMWIDHDGFLWMPAAQLNRMAPFQSGQSHVHYPVEVYKLKIGIGPPANDHP